MTLFSQFRKSIKSWSFWCVLLLTFLLYSFSNRFPLFLYPIPLIFFGIYFFKNFKNNKLSNFCLIFNILLLMFPLFQVLGGIYPFDYEFRIKDAIYFCSFILPLCFVFYVEIKKTPIENTYFNLLFSYMVISLFLFFIYTQGYIAENRYQHVGNALAANFILFFGLKKRGHKLLLSLLWLIMILQVGSRQALAGIFFVSLIFVFVSNYRVFFVFILFSLITFSYRSEVLDKISTLSHKYDLTTMKRIVDSIYSGGGNSANNRIRIYNDLIGEIGFFPNLEFSPNHDFALPHNFFLEYAINCGGIIGCFFFLFIFYLILKSILKSRNNILLYFSLFYFIPFNVSTGIGAAKYFIYYCFLLIVILEKRKNENIIG